MPALLISGYAILCCADRALLQQLAPIAPAVMVALNCAVRRSEFAKQIGLGRKAAAEQPRRKRARAQTHLRRRSPS
jgi:hypothetical protein